MKNIKTKYLLMVSILIGLLLFAACDDSRLDNSSARSAQTDIHDLLEEDSRFDSGYEWITVFNEDGTMENVRVPIVEYKITEAERAKEARRAAEVETVRLFRGRVLSVDSEIQSADSVMRSNQGIGILILGDGFTSTQQDLFSQNALDVYTHLTSTYPFNLYIQNIVGYSPLYISAQSGVSKDPKKDSPIVNNYFGSTFWYI